MQALFQSLTQISGEDTHILYTQLSQASTFSSFKELLGAKSKKRLYAWSRVCPYVADVYEISQNDTQYIQRVEF